MSTATALVAIDALKAVDVFAPGGVDRIIAEVERQVSLVSFDAAKEEDRKACAALAFKVARTKTGLDAMGKEFVAELKAQSGAIDRERKKLWDALEETQKRVRQPVTDWEAAETARVEAHVAALDRFVALGKFDVPEPTVEEIDARIKEAGELATRDWQEFHERAEQLAGRIPHDLTERRAATVRREEERAELERLRKAEVDRQERERLERAAQEQRQREEKIAAEAAEAAAQRARDEVAQANARADEERLQSEAKAERAREEERQRIAAEQAELEAAARKREADTEHRRTINQQAVKDLVEFAGVSETAAKKIVTAIASGQITNVKVVY